MHLQEMVRQNLLAIRASEARARLAHTAGFVAPQLRRISPLQVNSITLAPWAQRSLNAEGASTPMKISMQQKGAFPSAKCHPLPVYCLHCMCQILPATSFKGLEDAPSPETGLPPPSPPCLAG